MDLYLAVVAGVPLEQAVPLPVGRRLVLGRAPDADVALQHFTVGRHHCEVARDAGGVWVRFRFPHTWRRTLLNGQGIPRQFGTPLRAGDELRLGEFPVVRLVLLEPLWLSWNDGAVRKAAQVIRDERSYDRLPLLADALEEAGCTDGPILTHCRDRCGHGEGCWVTDMLLGKS